MLNARSVCSSLHSIPSARFSKCTACTCLLLLDITQSQTESIQALYHASWRLVGSAAPALSSLDYDRGFCTQNMMKRLLRWRWKFSNPMIAVSSLSSCSSHHCMPYTRSACMQRSTHWRQLQIQPWRAHSTEWAGCNGMQEDNRT